MDTRRKKRWSFSHAACHDCSTTKRSHAGLGRCKPCYDRTHYQKNRKKHDKVAARWRLRNRKRTKEIQNKAAKKFYLLHRKKLKNKS